MVTGERTLARPLLARVTPQLVVLLLVAAAAAAWTVIEADGMGDMPGTMGLGFTAFIGMWILMMAAMMLPSVAPFASLYARIVRERRFVRLVLFGFGYMAVWALVGVPAFLLALLAEEYAGGNAGTALAVLVFAACGIYQLTPLKYRCLSHCRSPLGHVMQAASRHGPLRDFRTGFEHGYFCAACCWGLMLLLLAFGMMNIPAMVLLASAVAAEKLWSWGERLSRGIGYASLAAAVLVIWQPGLAPGLSNEPMDVEAMAMDSMEADAGDASAME